MEKVKTFQVKDVCKICHVTRKVLLIYEAKGLLTPYYVNKESGYRYYNAENVSKIMYIRKFQSFGFSLDDIREYLTDTKTLSSLCDRLTALKEELENTIKEIKMRMMTEEYDKQEILHTVLPRCYCFAKTKVTHSFLEALNFLRETHLEAIKTDREDRAPRMFTCVLNYEGEYPNLFGTCEMLYAIPMLEGYNGPNAHVEQQTNAISIFHRGSYSTLTQSIKLILDYCKNKGIQAAGPMRILWLEGPPVHGDCEEKYLTEIAIPIQ